MRNIKKLTVVGITAFAVATMIPVTSMAAQNNPICKLYGVNNPTLSQNCKLESVEDALKQVAINGNCIKWGTVIIGNDNNKPESGEENGNQDTNDNINNEQDTNDEQNTNNEHDTSNGQNNNETNQTPETGEVTESYYAKQVLSLVNTERAKEGLAPLSWNTQVAKAAGVRAVEIQTSFSHTRPNGSNFSTVLRENGVNYRGTGENIAWGQKTPEQVVNAWMNSAGHRANIMNKNFTTLGVGYVQNTNGTPYWVQLFTYE